jgi:hypothetical protein
MTLVRAINIGDSSDDEMYLLINYQLVGGRRGCNFVFAVQKDVSMDAPNREPHEKWSFNEPVERHSQSCSNSMELGFATRNQ